MICNNNNHIIIHNVIVMVLFYVIYCMCNMYIYNCYSVNILYYF